MHLINVAGGIALVVFLFVQAVQAGEQKDGFSAENQAYVTQIGEQQRAVIDQKNLHGGVLSGAIQQHGGGNGAALTMEGGNLTGTVTQTGDNNNATLEIYDENNSGAIAQTGDDNSAGLRIEGYGQDVMLEQNGSGLTYDRPVVVGGDAPPGAITIRQY